MSECFRCNGHGNVPMPGWPRAYAFTCPLCGGTGEHPRVEVVSVPLSPEMQRVMDAARKAQDAIDADLERLLTPEALQRLKDSEDEATRRALSGEAP